MDALDAEDLERVKQLVGAMPERTRRVVTLRKVYGYSQDEIAHSLHITPQEVDDEIRRALTIMADDSEVEGE
jgi:RNA polymerase sigma factor (sigma-70 family)